MELGWLSANCWLPVDQSVEGSYPSKSSKQVFIGFVLSLRYFGECIEQLNT